MSDADGRPDGIAAGVSNEAAINFHFGTTFRAFSSSAPTNPYSSFPDSVNPNKGV